MNASSLRHPAGKFLLRHYVELSTVLVVLFVLQTGLIPFDFFERPGEGGAGELFGATRTPFTIPDIISNLMLYLPVGVFLHWSLCRVLRRGGLAVLLAMGLAAVLSGGIEWLQAYSPSRVSSVIDLVSNLSGAAMGIGMSSLARWLVPWFVAAVLLELRERPQFMLIKAYVGVLIFVAAMPFSFSFDTGLMKRSVESATWVPFGATATYHTTAETALRADNYYQFALAKWQRMKCWSRWAGETVSFGVLVWLAQPLLRRYYGFRRCGAAALIWWLCGGLAICLSGPHLIMVTRNFDVTDVLFRWLGIALGLTVRSLYVRPAADRRSEVQTGGWPRGVTLACAATLAYIVYVSVIPLTFSASEGGMGQAVWSAEFLPFFGYFVTRFDLMLDDVMEKLVVYALLAALLVTCSPRLQALSMWLRVATLATIGVMIAIPLEVVQMFIPIRVASLTDLILAGCGCAAGAIGQEYAITFYRFAISAEGPTSTEPTGEGSAVRVPSATDVLFDSLLDEDAAAPVEPSPTRKPTPRP